MKESGGPSNDGEGSGSTGEPTLLREEERRIVSKKPAVVLACDTANVAGWARLGGRSARHDSDHEPAGARTSGVTRVHRGRY